MKLKCWERNVGLCDRPCSEPYHTKLHFWGLRDTKVEKRSTQMEVNITNKIIEPIFFSSIVVMK
jgi:hypothetical protein